MKDRIRFSQAIDGYLLDAHARQLSPCTISDYTNAFRHFREYAGDPLIVVVDTDTIRAFLAHLGGKTVTPNGIASRGSLNLISHPTSKAIWRYLVTRSDPQPDDPLFANQAGRPLTRFGLSQLIQRLGKRVGIQSAHPHHFRHTFAINCLRNGGKTLELQRFLGHTTLEMVKRYVALAQVDLENTHRRASPVANWRL